VTSESTPIAPEDLAAVSPGRMGPAELEQLVASMALGDTAALTEFYDATVGKVVATARAILRQNEDAEEVTCDVYTQAWQTAARYDRSRGNVLAWLLTITRSRALDLLRQRRSRDRGLTPEEAGIDVVEDRPGGNPEDIMGLFQNGTAVHLALGRLTPLRRELVGLAFFSDLSHAQIASVTGLAIGTVKSHLRRALLEMRESLDG
jgi:RNA polymerase sigma-70 factor (ECF subfamily)